MPDDKKSGKKAKRVQKGREDHTQSSGGGKVKKKK